MIARRAFPWLYLALGFAQAAHSIEEVLAGLWKPAVSAALYERFSFIPRLEWSAPGFAAANLAIVALMLGLSPFVFIKMPWAVKTARVVAGIETLNGLGHLAAALLSGAYFPGCISGILLALVSIPLWAVPRVRRFPDGLD